MEDTTFDTSEVCAAPVGMAGAALSCDEAAWNNKLKTDWLHAADQGIAADAVGHVLVEVQRRVPGPSIQARMSILWRRLQAWHQRNGVENRQGNLVWYMVKQSGKSAKLRRKAAHLRALTPWVHQTTEEILGEATVHDCTV